ncbi:transcription factor IIIB 50 kDa subunit-like [Glandiceps talaboti]
MPTKCPQCGEAAVELDSHYTQEQKVCTNCGAVISEDECYQAEPDATGTFFFNDGSVPSSVLQKKYRDFDRKVLSKGRKEGIRNIKILGVSLKITKVMRCEALTLYERAYDSSTFKMLSLEKKYVLAGCCIYAVCRQAGWPITFKQMEDIMSCPKDVICSILKLLVEEFNIEISSLRVEDIVETTLKDYGITDSAIVEKTISVVQLAKETWITCGRQPQPVILAAAYLVWKSSFESSKKGVNYTVFCRTFKLRVDASARRRISEMEEVLLRLANELPWVLADNLDKHNVLHHLEDILKYEAMLTSSAKILPVSVSDEDNDNEHGSEISPPPSDTSPPPAPLLFTPCIKKTKKESKDTEVSIYDEHPVQLVSNSPELTEDDVADAELFKYLKTPEEVSLNSAVYTTLQGALEDSLVNPRKKKKK